MENVEDNHESQKIIKSICFYLKKGLVVFEFLSLYGLFPPSKKLVLLVLLEWDDLIIVLG